MSKSANFSLILIISCIFQYVTAQTGTSLFDESYVHEIRIYTGNTFIWDTLEYDYNMSNGGRIKHYRPVSIMIDSNLLDTVGFRIKGFYSAMGTGSSKKKPLKVDINRFNPEQEYEGIIKFNLQNAFLDPSFMRDMLAYNIFRTEGLPASRSSYARVYINEIFWGLYILVEQVDRRFLDNNFPDNRGNLYKSMAATNLEYINDNVEFYKDSIELKTNEEEDDWSRFIQFIKVINKVGLSDMRYEESINRYFNAEDYLKVLAIDKILINWDSYYEHGRNFYIYDEPSKDIFHWIPWDYNLSFADQSGPSLITSDWGEKKPLIDNLLDRPVFLKMYIDAYMGILDNNFTADRLFPLIDKTDSLIMQSVDDDFHKFYTYEAFKESLLSGGSTMVYDTFEFSCNMENVYFIPNENGWEIPDSVDWETICIIDTSMQTPIYDTIIVDTDTIYKVSVITTNEYQHDFNGLKDFISDRIDYVSNQVEDLKKTQNPTNPNYPTSYNIIAEIDNREFFVYPNPAKDFIILYRKYSIDDYHISVADMSGKVLISESNNDIIDISRLPNGFYLLKYECGKEIQIRKFIKH